MVRLGIWCEGGEIRDATRAIRFIDCVLTQATERRLIEVASHQAPVERTDAEIERINRFVEAQHARTQAANYNRRNLRAAR